MGKLLPTYVKDLLKYIANTLSELLQHMMAQSLSFRGQLLFTNGEDDLDHFLPGINNIISKLPFIYLLILPLSYNISLFDHLKHLGVTDIYIQMFPSSHSITEMGSQTAIVEEMIKNKFISTSKSE